MENDVNYHVRCITDSSRPIIQGLSWYSNPLTLSNTHRKSKQNFLKSGLDMATPSKTFRVFNIPTWPSFTIQTHLFPHQSYITGHSSSAFCLTLNADHATLLFHFIFKHMTFLALSKKFPSSFPNCGRRYITCCRYCNCNFTLIYEYHNLTRIPYIFSLRFLRLRAFVFVPLIKALPNECSSISLSFF